MEGMDHFASCATSAAPCPGSQALVKPWRSLRGTRPRRSRKRRLRRGHDDASDHEFSVPPRAGCCRRGAIGKRGHLANPPRSARPAAPRGPRWPFAATRDLRGSPGCAPTGTEEPAIFPHRSVLGTKRGGAQSHGCSNGWRLPLDSS